MSAARYLGAFCGSASRFLHRPFFRNGWTYASDACIAIRVPIEAGSPFDSAAPEIEDLPWPKGDEAGYVPLPPLPLRKTTACPECQSMANGKASRDCQECGGRGTVGESQRVAIGAAEFCSEYLRRVKLFLPQSEIIAPTEPTGKLTIRFRVENESELLGVGLLMPLRKAE